MCSPFHINLRNLRPQEHRAYHSQHPSQLQRQSPTKAAGAAVVETAAFAWASAPDCVGSPRVAARSALIGAQNKARPSVGCCRVWRRFFEVTERLGIGCTGCESKGGSYSAMECRDLHHRRSGTALTAITTHWTIATLNKISLAFRSSQ